MRAALLTALLAVAASGGVAAEASQAEPKGAEHGQGLRKLAAESRRPLERGGELERHSQRRKALRNVPAQVESPTKSSASLSTALPSFGGLGVSQDDADAIVKMRQAHPAQYAHSSEVVHAREFAALHEELSVSQQEQQHEDRADALREAELESADASLSAKPFVHFRAEQPEGTEEEESSLSTEELQRMRSADSDVKAPQAVSQDTEEVQSLKEEWLRTHQAVGEATAPQAAAAAEDAEADAPQAVADENADTAQPSV